MEKGLGKFSQYRKLRTEGAKNTDLEIRPAMGQKIVDDKEWSIPAVNDNTDYQAYLAWVAEGNEAEEVEQ